MSRTIELGTMMTTKIRDHIKNKNELVIILFFTAIFSWHILAAQCQNFDSRHEPVHSILPEHAGLRNSGIPLGGLGTGSVELRTDGRLHDWQVMNNKPYGMGPFLRYENDDISFFAVCAKGKNTDRTALLNLPGKFSGYLNNPYHLPWLEYPDFIESDVKFPFTRLSYQFPSFPLEITVEAFSPFIPLDSKNSGLPVAIFSFTLKNVHSETLAVSLISGLRNLVGYASDSLSVMTFKESGDAAGILFERDGLGETTDNGSIFLGAWAATEANTSYNLHCRHNRDIWDPMRTKNRLDNIDFARSSNEKWQFLRGGLPLAALAQQVKLSPLESTVIRVYLAWHFPYFKEAACQSIPGEGKVIGHQYSRWYTNAEQVFSYTHKNFNSLRNKTLQFTTACHESSLPGWMIQAITAQLTTLIKSSWWDQNGRFAIWEGLGCCGLQTIDITYYGSFPIVLFFPEIEKSQIRLSLSNLVDGCKIPHLMRANFSCTDGAKRIDLNPQFILTSWRDILWMGDQDYLSEIWNIIQKAMDYCDQLDRDGDGLPDNAGKDQTYDQLPLYGTSAYVGFLYAGAILATSQLAAINGDTSLAQNFHTKLKNVLAELDKQLWNGDYYRISNQSKTKQANEGIMTDQINADWFVRQTIGKGLLPDDKVNSALNSILKYCQNQWGYVSNCAFPFGGQPSYDIDDRVHSDQANTPWTGVEYVLAAHLMMMGREDQAIKITRDVWQRYEKAGLRFNHIECGQNYYRALSAWAIYLAYYGISMNSFKKSISFKMRQGKHQFILNTPSAWGVTKTDDQTGDVQLKICDGSLILSRLNIAQFMPEQAIVFHKAKKLEHTMQKHEAGIEILFNEEIILKRGESLNIHLIRPKEL